MGDYNPTRPFVLGNEFVGLREEGLVLTNASNSVEYGVGMFVSVPRALDHAKVYMDSPLWSPKTGQLLQVNVYPAGFESGSGPIQSVVIPASSLGNTAAGGTTNPLNLTSGGVTVNAVASTSILIAGALESPDSGNVINIPPGTPADTPSSSSVAVTFDMPRYLPQLVGKRVIGVNILIQAEGVAGTDVQALAFGCPLIMRASSGAGSWLTNVVVTSSPTLQRIKLPEVNPLWSNGSLTGVQEAQNWSTTQLANWNSTAPAGTTRLFAQLLRGPITIPPGVFTQIFSYQVSYLALEIVYCEEMRVATGTVFQNIKVSRQFGAQTIPMRTPAGVAGVTINPGEFIATVCAPFAQSTTLTTVDTTQFPQIPPLNALRQLYQLSSLPVVTVTKPFPPETALGQTFAETTSDVIPQLSLHTATAPIPESQAYGRRDEVPIWGAVTATQVINNNTLGSSQLFTQVRFYARRFGATLSPLRVESGVINASITTADFDALPGPIIDGWKEVTLLLNAGVSMGGTAGTINWVFSSTGQQPSGQIGARWEVLGAMAPAVSGVAGNATQPVVPSTDVLSTVTYTPITGDSIDLVWLSPPISGTTGASDPTSDATLMFSQDPPTPLGLTVTPSTQALTVALDCLTPPQSIPTGIGYNRVTWTTRVPGGVQDTFTRTVANGWGTADVGGTYTVLGTAAQYAVNGIQGTMSHAAVGVVHAAVLPVNVNDFTATLDFSGAASNFINSGSFRMAEISSQYIDDNNHYGSIVQIDSAGVMSFLLTKRVAGVETVLAGPIPTVLAYGTDTLFRFQVTKVGFNFSFKLALATDAMPPYSMGFGTDTTFAFPNPGPVAVRSLINVGSTVTTLPFVVAFDNFTVVPTVPGFGYFELQRSDAFDGTWQTVMLTASPAVSGFNDYEARVGILSSYRLRQGNQLGFLGAFSATATGSVRGPGATGRNVAASLLMFTTNEHQAGASNLAYTETVDSTIEDLNFAEAGRSQLQWMYGKDFQTAYQPTERGGEQFSRVMLVSQMAVAGPLLQQGFRTMRDLAWDDVTYVCVRNDIGDRWYANVNVPTGNFSRNRFLSNVSVQVTETYTTPSIVDPVVQQ